uniref:Uncharacterized protein n=1 Tax=Glossina austeni TaxID=7395 RepID=A0A1A9VQE5_GLOAU
MPVIAIEAISQTSPQLVVQPEQHYQRSHRHHHHHHHHYHHRVLASPLSKLQLRQMCSVNLWYAFNLPRYKFPEQLNTTCKLFKIEEKKAKLSIQHFIKCQNLSGIAFILISILELKGESDQEQEEDIRKKLTMDKHSLIYPISMHAIYEHVNVT